MSQKDKTEMKNSEEKDETLDDSISQLTQDGRERIRATIAGTPPAVSATTTVLALFIGGLCAWGLGGFGSTFISLLAFASGAYLSWDHLMDRTNVWLAAGRGLHITAIVLFFLPLVFYVPKIFGSATSDTLRGAGTFVGSLLGLIIWGIVFAFIALLLAVIGFFLNRKGKQIPAAN
jgi:uncharacterized membrane protein